MSSKMRKIIIRFTFVGRKSTEFFFGMSPRIVKNYAMRLTIISIIASASPVKGCKVKFKNIVIEWHTAKLRSTLIKLHVRKSLKILCESESNSLVRRHLSVSRNVFKAHHHVVYEVSALFSTASRDVTPELIESMINWNGLKRVLDD